MNLDDYIEGTYNPDNPANWDEDPADEDNDNENDINDIEVKDPEHLTIT
jgi:hypothetical protein